VGGRGRGEAYDFGRALDGEAPQSVAGDLDGGADDDAGEVPGAVLDDGEVEDPEEDEAVEDGAEDGEGEGGVVHPDHVGFVGHFLGQVEFTGVKAVVVEEEKDAGICLCVLLLPSFSGLPEKNSIYTPSSTSRSIMKLTLRS
jgi:hypothetical protein